MDAPLVSILSPTYNHARYLAQCIASVQAQTYAHWEMIILDDGSTDDTLAIAESFAAQDNRIRVLHQENVGVFRLGETYNKGLAQCHGKYIGILEGDDLWSPDKLQKQVSALEAQPGCVLSWAKAELVNEDLSHLYNLQPPGVTAIRESYLNIPTGAILLAMEHGNIVPALTMLFRKSALLEAGGFNQSFGMPLVDFSTILNISLLGPFHFANEVFGKWRIYSTQTTKKHTVAIYAGLRQFLAKHLPKVACLTETQRRTLLRNYDHLLLIAYARSGRYRLIRREYARARKDYVKAMTFPLFGEWTWRLRAATGFVFSLLHLNVEGLAKMLGRKTYKG